MSSQQEQYLSMLSVTRFVYKRKNTHQIEKCQVIWQVAIARDKYYDNS